ncbi:MAG: ATP-binding cassette domain-containing protein [Methanobacteriota archaeon]|nr:MAG: ATP-binding cassette domain-containing protein [Euryarchaeota archaeon]
MLKIENLNVRYLGRSKPAVSDLSMTINTGEIVLLAGSSASGKSTIMQAACGFIPHIIPAEISGVIKLDGQVYDDPSTIAGVACMVQQDPETQFCTETVEEEVAFGPENFRYSNERIRESVDKALASVKADHLKDRTLSTLSGGEKQKVAIASMLALSPRLLILDEPTASLDPRSIGQVVSAVESIKSVADITVIVVEHRIKDFIDLVDRLIVIDEGKLSLDSHRGEEGFMVERDRARVPPDYPSPKDREDVPIITVRGLSLEIGGWQILDDVSLDIRKNSVMALMGENGSGKTTLLRHIIGLQRIQEGEITVCGHRMTRSSAIDAWTLGRDVGFVFQNPNHQIFEDTVEQEVLFAARNFLTPVTKAEEAITEFEERERLKRFVHPHCLSFGQKRRVNILSAYSHEPQVLLMDEPFAGQDQANVDAIASMANDIHGMGKTLVIVTHDPDFARRFCTDVAVLHEGRVVAAGPVESILDAVWRNLRGEARDDYQGQS